MLKTHDLATNGKQMDLEGRGKLMVTEKGFQDDRKVLNMEATDILDQILLCCDCGPAHYRLLAASLSSSSTATPVVNNRKFPDIVTRPLGGQITPSGELLVSVVAVPLRRVSATGGARTAL